MTDPRSTVPQDLHERLQEPARGSGSRPAQEREHYVVHQAPDHPQPCPLEHLLARLYTDADFRQAFVLEPVATARRAGLDEADAARLAGIDRDGLALAAESFAHKRQAHAARRSGRSTLSDLWRRVARAGR